MKKFKQHRNLIFLVMGLMSIIFISPVQAQFKTLKKAGKKVHKVVKKSTKPHELVTKKNAVKVAKGVKLVGHGTKEIGKMYKDKVVKPVYNGTKKGAVKAGKGVKFVGHGTKEIGKMYKDKVVKPAYKGAKKYKVLTPHKVIYKKAKKLYPNGKVVPISEDEPKPDTAPEDDSIKKPIDSFSIKSDRLRELKRLLDEGILTQEEFDKEKKKVLDEN